MRIAGLKGALVLLLLAFVGLVGPEFSQAQVIGRVENTETNATDYYWHVRPGTRTIQVHVIGAVQTPGLYEVNDDFSMGQLLALTGGPQIGTRTRRTKRQIKIRLFRPATNSTVPLYESELEDGAIYTNSYPALQEGDVLRVDVVERTGFSWRDGLQILTAAASVYIVLDRGSR